MSKASRIVDMAVTADITDYAIDNYSLEDALLELELPTEWISNDEVIEAFNNGLIHTYIQEKISGAIDAYIIEDTEITQQQCNEWAILYQEPIRLQRLQINQEEREKAEQFSNPIKSGVRNLVAQNKELINGTAQAVVTEDITEMIAKLKSGNTEDILSVLVSQTLQLQSLTNKITQTAGNSNHYDIMQKFQNMQLKTMAETRKTVMAINEVINPKRTTFIKEASQHNHLHQNSQEKTHIKNELQAPEPVTEAEIIPLKERAQ